MSKIKSIFTNAPFPIVILLMTIAFGIMLLINIFVFQTACDYPYSPEWLCWVDKPLWLHPGWVLPLTLVLTGLFIYYIIKKAS